MTNNDESERRMTTPPNDPSTIEERHDAIDALQGSLLSPATPELDKQAAIIKSGRAETVQEFYDWLHEEKGWVLARYIPEDEREPHDGIYGEQPVAVFIQPEDLMAEFFGIDRNKIEAERRALLDAIRSQS